MYRDVQFTFILDYINKCESLGYSFRQPAADTAICFKFHTTPLDFNSASNECQKSSATLIRIRNLSIILEIKTYLIAVSGKVSFVRHIDCSA